ncbi:MAG TPA: VWA domain-containing protein [Terriglobales bacterium]|nr:VWA domain-containing protein [Terriglobales bacterium]
MRRRNSCLNLVLLLGLTPFVLSQADVAPLSERPAAPSSTQTAAPAQSSDTTPASTPSTTPPATAPTTPPSAAAPGNAQAPVGGDAGGFVFTKRVEEVVLHAVVFDDKQRFVTNLDKNAFTVFEDGHPQAITSFRHEDIPVSIGIVVDNSGSMREKRQKVNAAALNLVRASNPDDEVFVVNFNDEYYLDQDYTANINKLKEALEKIEARGGTALYDAVVASADWLKQAKREKKVIFVVTDGEDTASSQSLEQAVRRLQAENGPTVYSIGILGDEEHPKRARRALQVMAERTGGIAFFPKTLDEVDAISRSVAHDIRNQYTIGYKPSTPKNQGGYRTVRVDAKSRSYGKLVVRTRSGYYAATEAASGTK